MRKKKEKTYQLTFKGFILSINGMNEAVTDSFTDSLELWLRRINCNAVVLTKAGEFETHKVYLEDK